MNRTFASRQVRFIRFGRRKRRLLYVGDLAVMRYDKLVYLFNRIIFIHTDGKFSVKFGQPYYVDSIRLCFHNHRNPANFFIAVSRNGRIWETAVPRTQETPDNNIWYHFTFRPHVIMFIDFISNLGIPTNIFQCQLECPSQDPAYLAEHKLKLLNLKPV